MTNAKIKPNAVGYNPMGSLLCEAGFKEGNFDGKLYEKFQSGAEYWGHYDHKRGKHGQATWRDDAMEFQGIYEKNKINGEGFMLFKSGNCYKGKHKSYEKASNNICTYRHGKGSFTWPNGYKFEGEYKWGKRQGGNATKNGMTISCTSRPSHHPTLQHTLTSDTSSITFPQVL